MGVKGKIKSFSAILLSVCVVLSVLLLFSSTVASTNTDLNARKSYPAKKTEDFNVEAFPGVFGGFGGRGFPIRGRGFPIRGRGYPIRRYPRGRGFIRRPDPSGECPACCGNLFNDQCTVCC